MKWIEKIVSVVPYVVTCRWNDGKIREVNLEKLLLDKSRNPENPYAQLREVNRFLEVKCDGSTLFWENGLKYEDLDGITKKGPLDVAPERLFEFTDDGKVLLVSS